MRPCKRIQCFQVVFMMTNVRLLVAETDSSVREILRLAAAEQGWICDEAVDGIAALKLLRRKKYDAVVLDAGLPDVDGYLVCGQIRRGAYTPVIFIGNSGAETDRLAAFEAGGNDYVQKPFYPREMIARIRSLLTLAGYRDEKTEKAVSVGGLLIDTQLRSVQLGGRELQLTPKEYELLLFLCRRPYQAFSRDNLLDEVWGREFYGSDRTVDTHVKSLRSKMQPYDYIETVWGFGYKLVC